MKNTAAPVAIHRSCWRCSASARRLRTNNDAIDSRMQTRSASSPARPEHRPRRDRAAVLRGHERAGDGDARRSMRARPTATPETAGVRPEGGAAGAYPSGRTGAPRSSRRNREAAALGRAACRAPADADDEDEPADRVLRTAERHQEPGDREATGRAPTAKSRRFPASSRRCGPHRGPAESATRCRTRTTRWRRRRAPRRATASGWHRAGSLRDGHGTPPPVPLGPSPRAAPSTRTGCPAPRPPSTPPRRSRRRPPRTEAAGRCSPRRR